MLGFAAWKASGSRVGVRIGKLVGPPVLSPAE
jgi:hypothetical protein